MTIEVGKPAPAFTLPATGGVPISLEALRGRKVVIYFYPKDDTSGCTKEAQEFSALRAEFAQAGAEIVGVSADDMKSHERFKAKYDLDLILASDESRAMLEVYGVWVEKSMYGRKYMGIERTTVLVGADGRVARVWPKVKVPGHAREVLEAVRGS
ncbi:MAG TPA: peroxiredoxin [Salinarimonas sp.]|nr:peroxiredoxin [Salinarimonas sp.]